MKGHIRKRGKESWQVIVYLGKDENGKKKYKSKTVRGKRKDAQRILKDLLYQIENNCYCDPSNMTFGDYLEWWFNDYCTIKLAPTTLARYKEIIKLHISPALGCVKLIELHPMHLQRYYSEALRNGRIGRKYQKNKGLSPTTVLQHHRIIHKALQQAMKWQIVKRNIANAVEPPKRDNFEYELISKDDLIKLLKIIREQRPVIFLPTLLAASLGLRRGETLGLQWKDIDLDCRHITVKQQLQRLEGKLSLTSVKSKGSKRLILLPEFIIDLLNKWKTEQDELFKDNGKQYQKYNLICTWPDGRPIDPDYLTKKFIGIAQEYGFNIRFHDLRHYYASFLLSKGVHSKIVSEILGHSSIGITLDTYSHVVPSMQEQAVKFIQDSFEELMKN